MIRGAPALSCIAPTVRGRLGGDGDRGAMPTQGVALGYRALHLRCGGDWGDGGPRMPTLSCNAPSVRGTIGAMAANPTDSVRRIRLCDVATIPSTPRERYGCDDTPPVAQCNDEPFRTETRLRLNHHSLPATQNYGHQSRHEPSSMKAISTRVARQPNSRLRFPQFHLRCGLFRQESRAVFLRHDGWIIGS